MDVERLRSAGIAFKIRCCCRGCAYLDPESEFIDMDGDGIRDNPLPSISALLVKF